MRESEILFPYQSNTPSLSSTLSTLRRSTLSLHNRLSSIASDSVFVTSVASAYRLPLIANERCGSWYIPSSQKAGSVYFKSTDGHMGQWSLSLRRLNLQLLDVVANRGGAVVVDSTRRGKSMPDALSKTVPVWCVVVNRAIFQGDINDGESERGRLYVPPSVVGESERIQIEARIEGFVKQFLEICKPHLPALRAKITRPLRPIWITQASSLPPTPPSFSDFYPIILCTASRRVHGAEISENGYIQGAADDHEAWANGLTPQLFWQHQDLLMNTPEGEAPRVIKRLIDEEEGTIATATLIKPTVNVYVSSSEGVDLSKFDAVIACTPTPLNFSKLSVQGTKHHLHLKCQVGKLGSRDLRTQLPRLTEFLSSLSPLCSRKILVCCPTGKDLSVGAALAVLCLASDDQGNMLSNSRATGITKDFIKQRLSWITTSNPALNPSRATLQSVNAVLFDNQLPKPLSCKDTSLPQARLSSDTIAVSESTPPIAKTPNTSVAPPPSQPPTPPTPEQLFRALATPWNFTRTLTSTLPTHPSGTVTGTATFTPCPHPSKTPTLLYAEEGEFILANGMKFGVKRRYVYQLLESSLSSSSFTAIASDSASQFHTDNPDGVAATTARAAGNAHMAVFFFDDEKMGKALVGEGIGSQGEGVGGLFVEMGGLEGHAGSGSGGGGGGGGEVTAWEAENRERHLCAEDLYAARWRFGSGMVEEGSQEEAWWEVVYDVKGPKKEYTSCTRYMRA